MKRILNAAVILLTVLLSASLPVSAEQSQVGVNAAASTIVVRGKVVDEKNEPFAGVSIVAKKATNGVITGVDVHLKSMSSRMTNSSSLSLVIRI